MPINREEAVSSNRVIIPIPLKESDITLERFKHAIQKNGYELNAVGITTFGIRNHDMTAGIFNDFLGIYYISGGKEYMEIDTGTVDPGTYYLKHPMHPEGTAVMKFGFYKNSYSVGFHNGKYEALVQVKPIYFYRITKEQFEQDNQGVLANKWKSDLNNKKCIFDKIGANQHRAAASGTTEFIGMFSAGCQVRNNAADYKKFIDTCKKAKQKYFDYILLPSNDLFI